MAQLEFKHTHLTLSDVADSYGISISTLHKWLKPIKNDLLKLSKVNTKRLRTLNSKQLNKIQNFLSA